MRKEKRYEEVELSPWEMDSYCHNNCKYLEGNVCTCPKECPYSLDDQISSFLQKVLSEKDFDKARDLITRLENVLGYENFRA